MDAMLRFDDVILARPVPLEHGGETEVKDRDALEQACLKLDTLPIYYGLQHREVDARGGIRDAIGRARRLRYDHQRDAVVGDIELDVLPEELARLGKVGYSAWYSTDKDGDRLTNIMWKHILATPTPLDDALETRLEQGYLVGESKEVSPPVSPPSDAVKTVSQPSEPSDETMPDEKPEAPPVEPPKAPEPKKEPEPPPDYTEARKELIQEYRDRLKGKLPDAAIKSLTLKALRDTYAEIKAQEAEAKEPEHPEQPRTGLPAPSGQTGDLVELQTTEGNYVTLPGFVEKLGDRYSKANPNAPPYTVLTGPVSSYSNVAPVNAAEKARLAREARGK